jgi:hypothetical protein
MRNTKYANEPILKFDTPTAGRPKNIADAQARFDASATRYAKLKGEKKESSQAIEAAKKQDVSDLVERLRAGGEAKPEHSHEAAARAKLAEIESTLTALAIVVDEDGDALVEAIGAEQEGWLATLRANDEAAASRFDELVAELEPVLVELGAARAAVDWLERYTVHDAKNQGWHAAKDVRYRPNARLDAVLPQFDYNTARKGDGFQVAAPMLVAGLRSVTAAS